MDVTQIILIVFIVGLLIAYPIMMTSKNKKENQRMQEQTNSLKRGDKVITTSGVYGKIVDLHSEDDKTIVTIETGTEKNKGYISVDAYAIYTIIKDEVAVNEKKEDLKENTQVLESKEEKLEESKTEENSVEPSVEKSNNKSKKERKK